MQGEGRIALAELQSNFAPCPAHPMEKSSLREARGYSPKTIPLRSADCHVNIFSKSIAFLFAECYTGKVISSKTLHFVTLKPAHSGCKHLLPGWK
jgi:hypothetical protein